MRNFKRIFALLLTVLMVVGVIPMTVFAAERNLPTVPEEDYTGSAIGEKDVEGLIKTDGKYWHKIPYQSGSVDPTGRTVSGSRLFTYRSGVTVYNDNTGVVENVWRKNEAGLDILMDMIFKLDNNKTGSMLIGVLHHIRGGITLLDARSYGDGTAELYYYNSENSGATAKKLCDLPADNYTRVQVLLDVGGTSENDDSNTVYVFLDGKLAVTDKFLADENLANEYKTFTSNDYEKGFLLSGYFFDPNSTGAVIEVEEFTPYYYDTDGNGNVSDTPRCRLIVPSNTANEKLLNSIYSSDKSYWQKVNISPDASGNTISANRWFAVREGLTALGDTAGLKTNVYEKNLAGLDFAMDMSFKLDNSKSGKMAIGLLHYYKGGITLLEARSYGNGFAELYYTNTENGGATERKLCDLPADEYTRVQMLFDVGGTSAANESNTVYIFIDGALIYSDAFLSTGAIDYEYKFFTSSDFAKGFMASGYFFNSYSTGAVIDVKDVAMYLYDDDADGDLTNSSRATPVMHFNDFENEAAGAEHIAGTRFNGTFNGVSDASITSHPVKIHSDSNTNKAIYTEASGDTYYQLYGKNVKGADFILSYDVKLKNATTTSGSMFWAASTGAVALNLTPISTRTDGSLYIDKDYMLTQCFGGEFGDTKVGQLSTEYYTNITIVFNVSANKYRVYVNHVDTMGEMTMLDADTKAKYGEEGFYLTQIRMQYRNYYLDNIALYYGDTYYNEVSNEELLNGYKKEGGKLYYYENGFAAVNKDLDQNIVVTDENGAVKIGDTYPVALNAIYTYVGNGDKVLVDGLYEGFYQVGARAYYYANKNRVTGVDFPYFVADTAYKFDEYGVANEYQGINENRLFINGKLQKDGVFTYGGNKYLAGSDGVFTSGIVTIDGEEWIFNSENGFKGEIIVVEGDVAVDANSGTRYENIKDAIDNAEENGTLKLYGDMTSKEAITLDKGITVNLNGNTITAPQVTITAGTDIVVSKENKGYINVEKGNLIVGIQSSEVISYYEEGKGYTFAEVKKQDSATENGGKITYNENRDGFTFIFRPSLDDDTALNTSTFGNGALDNSLTFFVNLTKEDGTVIRSFRYSDALVADAYGANKKALQITVKGLDYLKHGNVKVAYGLISDTGLICEIEAGICNLAKKSVSILGDSISTYDGWSNNAEYNSTIGNNLIFYSETNPYKAGADFSVENTWWYKVSNNSEFEFCVNNSVSGSRVNMEATHVTRPQNLHNTTTGQTPDVIIIYIGINDWAASVALGSYDGSGELPTAPATFSEMYANIIKLAKEAYPGVEIYCCTLLPEESRKKNGVNDAGVSIKQYNEVIAKLAVNMGATVIDLYNDSGFTFGNLSKYTIDNLHPNEAGMQLIADTVLDVISTHIKKPKLSILGDSISSFKGYVPDGNRSYYAGEYPNNDVSEDVSNTWWHMLAVEKGYNIEINQSSASSPVCNVGLNGADASGFSFINRMKNLGNPDVIAIYGGTNDAVGSAALGEYKYDNWTTDDLKNFRPAYAYMLDYLKTNHPNAQIVVIIQPNLDIYKPGIEASIIEICEHYDVDYVLLPSDLSTCDNFVHPSKLGMQQIFDTIKDCFK